jgi:hypothetical protein
MLSCTVGTSGLVGEDMQAQVQLLMKSPDVAYSGTFELPARSDVLDKMLDFPMLLARLWEVYQFGPAYYRY